MTTLHSECPTQHSERSLQAERWEWRFEWKGQGSSSTPVSPFPGYAAQRRGKIPRCQPGGKIEGYSGVWRV